MSIPTRTSRWRPRAGTSPSDYLRHGVFLTLYGLVKNWPPPIGSVARAAVVRPFLRRCGSVRIYDGTTIWYPERISIGARVTLNEWVYLSGYGGLTIGDDVAVGHRCSIVTSNHDFTDPQTPIKQQGLTGAPVVLRDGAWLGANVTVLAGVTVGRNAVVAAGAVVTTDVPDYAVAAGVPARVVRVRHADDTA